MPIEFHCQNCSRLMRTPDSAAGKKGKCPHCGAMMDIPLQSGPRASAPAGRTRESSEGTPGEKARGGGDANDKIEFPCPRCSLPVRTPASAAGKKGKCPNCGEVVQIPLKATNGRETEVKPSAKIQFRCPGCQKMLRTPADVAGKKIRCPSCSAVLSIPSSSQRKGHAGAPSGTASVPDDSIGLAPMDDAPGLAPPDDADGLIAVDETAALTPVDDGLGLIPLEEIPSLEPMDDSAGLTPLEPYPTLTPVADDPLANAAAYQGSTGAISPASGDTGPNPFGDDFGNPASAPGAMAVNPYQSPALASAGYAAGPSKPFNETIVTAPAIAMLVVLALNCCAMIPYLIFYAIGAISAAKAEGGDEAAFIGFVVGSIIGVLIFVVAYIFMIFGAWKMMRLESYGLALTTAILMLLPCTMCWIGMPFGIWALVVLCLPDVRQAFA